MKKIAIVALLLTALFVFSCANPIVDEEAIAPTIISTLPTDSATAVARNQTVEVTFSKDMDSATLNTDSFTLMAGATPVAGAVSTLGAVSSFNPTGDLAPNTLYTATVTVTAADLAGNALAAEKVWTFTTGGTSATGPAVVNLGTARDFVILAKAGIDTIPTSVITGDIGVSPISSLAITGFSLALDSSGTYATSSQIEGKAYAANYTSPAPVKMTTAIYDMEVAYTDAAGRATPDFVELGSGEIGGLTLVPGLYKWGTDVLISTDVTLSGGPSDVWIFQISGGITQASGIRVHLTGGALAKNIFWQTFGPVALNTTAHFEGIVISSTEITLATGASVNGRLLSHTAITLASSTVVQPAP
ncbi:MAG: ice-binding family protein [Rectinemataceae bacterium]|nr:ice-binding family protein [Rectinemataceae bacterium]